MGGFGGRRLLHWLKSSYCVQLRRKLQDLTTRRTNGDLHPERSACRVGQVEAKIEAARSGAATVWSGAFSLQVRFDQTAAGAKQTFSHKFVLEGFENQSSMRSTTP